jgi:hypothetical protein
MNGPEDAAAGAGSSGAAPPPDAEAQADAGPADPADAADASWQATEDEAARRRRERRVGSERIGAYAEAIKVIGDLLHPANAADEASPRRRPRLDPLLRGELELALRAMAADIRRLAAGSDSLDLG